jgi:hypothetical protein
MRLAISILLLIMVPALSGCPDNGQRYNSTEDEESGHGFLETANPSQHPGQISGTVYVNGNPQAFGTVQVFDMDGNQAGQERCTEYGHYTIKDLLPGRYNVVYLSASGRQLGEPTMVQVRPGRMEQVDLHIEAGQ